MVKCECGQTPTYNSGKDEYFCPACWTVIPHDPIVGLMDIPEIEELLGEPMPSSTEDNPF